MTRCTFFLALFPYDKDADVDGDDDENNGDDDEANDDDDNDEYQDDYNDDNDDFYVDDDVYNDDNYDDNDDNVTMTNTTMTTMTVAAHEKWKVEQENCRINGYNFMPWRLGKLFFLGARALSSALSNA